MPSANCTRPMYLITPTWWLNRTFMPTSSQCWLVFFFDGLIVSMAVMLCHPGLLLSILCVNKIKRRLVTKKHSLILSNYYLEPSDLGWDVDGVGWNGDSLVRCWVERLRRIVVGAELGEDFAGKLRLERRVSVVARRGVSGSTWILMSNCSL